MSGALDQLGPRCLTTEAVVTEATHLVSRGAAPAHIPFDFILAAEVLVVHLERSATTMRLG